MNSKAFYSIACGLCILLFSAAPTLAGRFDGTYEGKARVQIGGEPTWVFAQLVIHNTSTKLTLFRYNNGEVGPELEQFDVKAFLDNRGTFFGILLNDDVIVAGFGGRINGRHDNQRVLGKFIQDSFRRPFILKEVAEP